MKVIKVRNVNDAILRGIDLFQDETNYIENKFKYMPDKGGGYSNFGFYILQNKEYDIIEIKK